MPVRRIVVQSVVVQWSKRSRGQPGAGRRAATPRAYALPADLLADEGEVVLHEIDCREGEGFAPRRRAARARVRLDRTQAAPAYVIGCARVTPLAGGLEVRFAYDELTAGAPRERPRHAPFSLAVGEWGQVEWNGRFSGWEDWWYAHHAVNVALVEGAVAADLFLARPPAGRSAELADLW